MEALESLNFDEMLAFTLTFPPTLSPHIFFVGGGARAPLPLYLSPIIQKRTGGAVFIRPDLSRLGYAL